MSIDKSLDEVRGLAQQGKKEAAFSLIERLIQDHPDESRLWSLQASLYERTGDYVKAINSINKALDLSPQKATFFFHRARYNLQSGNAAEAVNDLNSALDKDSYGDISFTTELYFYRAEAFIKLGKKKEALADIARIQDDYKTWTLELRGKEDLVKDCNKL